MSFQIIVDNRVKTYKQRQKTDHDSVQIMVKNKMWALKHESINRFIYLFHKVKKKKFKK